jgi:hypothetical protein
MRLLQSLPEAWSGLRFRKSLSCHGMPTHPSSPTAQDMRFLRKSRVVLQCGGLVAVLRLKVFQALAMIETQ